MAELDTLRSAKQALKEQLITQQDFDCVKVAYLRAQQIKAGLDAGFIRKQDYDRTVEAYLHAMDFQLIAATPSISAPHSVNTNCVGQPATANVQTPVASGPAAAAPRSSVMAAGSPSQLLSARNSSSGSGAIAGPTADASKLLTNNSNHEVSTLQSLAGPEKSVSISDEPGTCVEIPVDLPDYCKGATAGKKSMSGIGIDESCVNLFMHMKTKSMYKWLIFKVDGSGRMVVPEKIGGQSSTYNELVCALPDDHCRYAVYDYEYKSPERGTFKKLVFLLWAPEHSGIKPKMMYASTKDFFKGFLDGIGAELQANEPCELSEEEIRDRVLSNMTRK